MPHDLPHYNQNLLQASSAPLNRIPPSCLPLHLTCIRVSNGERSSNDGALAGKCLDIG